jgi:hypothetical protein
MNQIDEVNEVDAEQLVNDVEIIKVDKASILLIF